MTAPVTTAAPSAPVQPTLPGTQAPTQDTTVSIPQAFLAELAAAKDTAAKLAAERDEVAKQIAALNETHSLTTKQLADAAEAKRQLLISHAVRDAARVHGAVDPDEVTTLLAGQFTLDDKGNVIATGETKAPAADVVKAWLEKRPHHVNARVARGTGASPYPAQAPATGQAYDLTTAEGLTAWARERTRASVPQRR